MSQTELKDRLLAQDYVDPNMLHAAFSFWFNDQAHIRSPFPEYIREELRDTTVSRFLDWTGQLSAKARKEINDEILAEKMEELLFEQALEMVKTTDEKISLLYPFLPRLGDKIVVTDIPGNEGESEVISRCIEKRGDHAFMKVTMKNLASGACWEREFELPA